MCYTPMLLCQDYRELDSFKNARIIPTTCSLTFVSHRTNTSVSSVAQVTMGSCLYRKSKLKWNNKQGYQSCVHNKSFTAYFVCLQGCNVCVTEHSNMFVCNHNTNYSWSKAPKGKKSRDCLVAVLKYHRMIQKSWMGAFIDLVILKSTWSTWVPVSKISEERWQLFDYAVSLRLVMRLKILQVFISSWDLKGLT